MYWRRESQTQGVRDSGHAKGGKARDWQQMREKDVRQIVGRAVDENGETGLRACRPNCGAP
jgi:hypothetical protein